MELMSNRMIAEVESKFVKFKKVLEQYIDDVNTIIKSFDTSDIVQSLYKSGKFGAEEEEKIKKIKKYLDQFQEKILYKENGLIKVSKRFLNQQRDLNNRGNVG